MKTSVLWASAGLVALSGCSSAEDPDAATGPAGDAPPAADQVTYVDGVYDGPRVTNLRGGYQAQVEIADGRIVRVSPIEAGTDAPESVQTNAFAVPALVERVLEAQSADVDHVSGSSFTSPAFLESIAGALEQARD